MNTEQGIKNNEVLTVCNNTGYLNFEVIPKRKKNKNATKTPSH